MSTSASAGEHVSSFSSFRWVCFQSASVSSPRLSSRRPYFPGVLLLDVSVADDLLELSRRRWNEIDLLTDSPSIIFIRLSRSSSLSISSSSSLKSSGRVDC